MILLIGLGVVNLSDRLPRLQEYVLAFVLVLATNVVDSYSQKLKKLVSFAFLCWETSGTHRISCPNSSGEQVNLFGSSKLSR
jgi:hypothetical protein